MAPQCPQRKTLTPCLATWLPLALLPSVPATPQLLTVGIFQMQAPCLVHPSLDCLLDTHSSTQMSPPPATQAWDYMQLSFVSHFPYPICLEAPQEQAGSPVRLVTACSQGPGQCLVCGAVTRTWG